MSDEASFNHIAVIGLVGRFPGARSVDELWRNLRDGVESVSFFTDQELLAAGTPPETLAAPNYVKAKSVLADADLFDAAHFGYSPSEAELMDPQHRVFLECAWEALESAGYDPWRFAGRIAVFAGVSGSSYLGNLLSSPEVRGRVSDLQVVIGNDKDFLPTRVSYKLNLRGPSLAVQTACSSSLVATHLACQSLINQEADLALAGGVSVKVPLKSGYFYLEGGHRSPDGHCRAFDAGANGTAFGDGVGIVVLKRLASALADGDTIHAVIRGSAINNDGAVKVGYTAPSVQGQAEVLAEALAVAGLEPEAVAMVEAHGTGTTLGDPIEFEALEQVYGGARPGNGRPWCALGSVKTNVGHLDAAAGVTGLIKAILSLENRELPPSLHFERPNPRLALEGSPFYVNSRLRSWESRGPRRAAVSSFGVGGTNAHAVLEEAPAPEPSGPSRPWQILPLSARTGTALAAMAKNLTAALREEGAPPLPDVAWTLQTGRQALERRAVVVCRNVQEAVAALDSPDLVETAGRVAGQGGRPVIFLFPGQGTQSPGMTTALYASEPVFREEIDRCAEGLGPHLGLDLRTLLRAEPGPGDAPSELDQTRFAQPALFAVEYALASLWMSWGLRPVAMLGHSVGELVAACLAGVFQLPDALALVAARGALMQAQAPGAMIAVPRAAAEIEALLGQALAIAAINGPDQCVVSGPRPEVDAFAARLAEQGVSGRPLKTSHAFHSPMMDPVLEPFRQLLARRTLRLPSIPFASCLTGTWIRPEEATDPAYWSRQLRGTVRFADALALALREPDRVLLEVGPGRSLTSLAKRQGARAAVASLEDRAAEERSLANALGRLWQAGVEIDWERLHAGERRRRVPLPTYPFERRRYFVERGTPASPAPALSALARRADLADWFDVASWKRLGPLPDPAPASARPEPWLLLLDELGIGEELARRLEAAGQAVTRVPSGADGEGLLAAGSHPRIVDLSLLTRPAAAPDGPSEDLLERCFYRLLRRGQALGRRAGARPVQLTLVANGVFEVIGGERLEPEKAALLGPLHVLPLEMPHLSCRAIEVDLPAAGEEESWLEQLLAELTAETRLPEVALRRGHRWGRSLEPLRLGPAEPGRGPLRPGGVYLVTGGLGGLGLVVARVLAEAVTARLVLVGRTELPPREAWGDWLRSHPADDPVSERLAKIAELEALGAEVLAASADVADATALESVIGEALARFGRIDGIFHAAGLPGSGLAQGKSREEAARVLAPKVQGAFALERLFAGRPLDFVWLFSSLNALYGGLGQVDYAAANAVLDALAHRWSAHGTPVTALDWDAWSEVGMAAPRRPASPAPPALGRLVLASDEETLFESELAAGFAWVADEHNLLGRPVLPGTAYLEMARALFAAVRPGVPVEISDVVFVAPLAAGPAPRRVRSTLRRSGDAYQFEIASRPAGSVEGSWQPHALGRLGELATPPAPVALNELRTRHAEADPEPVRSWWSDPGRPGGLAGDEVAKYGPRWRSLVSLRVGEESAVAELRLADACAGDLADPGLHPALLDVAVGHLYRCRDRGAYAPFGYRRVRVHAALPQSFLSYVRRTPADGEEALTYDAVLCGEDGRVLVEIAGYSYRRVRRAEPLPGRPAGDAGGGELRGIRTAEGTEAVRRLLGHRLPRQAVVAPVDPDRLAAELKARLLQHQTEPAAPGRSHPRPDLSAPYVAPRSEREETLAEIFREVLALDRVGAEDSFFELGGDSVIALQVIARAQRAGLPLTPNDLFASPTIAALARTAGMEAGKALPALAARDRDVSAPLPLSLNQERYWARYRRGGPSASLNLPVAVGLRGELDVRALEASLRTIFDRHEALRTVFREGDESGAVQIVLPPFPVPVPRVDLSALPAGPREVEARRISDAVGSYVFDLERELLFLLVLVRLDEREHRLVTVKHHLITDGWSGGLFAQELAELYRAAVRGEEPQLPALPVQYGDFALWQREHFRREGVLAGQMEYWRTALSHGDFPVLRLPGDRPRRSGGGFVGLEEVRLFPNESIDGLRELARRENATLFMALLSAVNVLLYSRTGLTDLALTTDLANRSQIEIEKLIGLFTNVVVLRSHLDGDPSFRELLARAKRVTLDSFAHQDLPFAELMAELKAGWLESYHEVFPVAFVFQNYPGRDFTLPGLALSAVEIEPGAVSRDLLIVLGETPRGVRVMFRYRSDCFLPETVRKMVDDLSALIESIVRDPDQSLSDLVEGIGAVVPAIPENLVCEPVGG